MTNPSEPAGSQADVAYLLPRHPAEVDRLDVQHHALRVARGGNFRAPVERPALVVDVGTGTAQWAHEVGRQFPDALVIGLDLVPGKPGGPGNYRGVRGNVLQGLPFRDGCADFVHQRLLFSGVPVRSWQAEVAELVRVVRPNGWIELVESATEFLPASPAMERLSEMLRRLNRTRGLDSTSIIFRSIDSYLTAAGAEGVERQTLTLPVGEWGGRLGSLMASDVRALFLRLGDVFAAAFGVPLVECHELVRAAQAEWEEYQTTYSFAVAWGRKPG